jgi:hypothetical protein
MDSAVHTCTLATNTLVPGPGNSVTEHLTGVAFNPGNRVPAPAQWLHGI